MAFKPNYRQQRGDRARAKEQKQQERRHGGNLFLPSPPGPLSHSGARGSQSLPPPPFVGEGGRGGGGRNKKPR